MNKTQKAAAFLSLLLLSSPVFSGVLSRHGRPLYRPDEIVVRFNDDASESQKANVLAVGTSHVSSLFQSSSISNVHVLKLAVGTDVSRMAENLKRSPGVKDAQPNYCYYATSACANIPTSSTDVFYAAPYNWPFTKIQATQAWNLAAWTVCPGNGVTVAVLDTGISRKNPDLHNVPMIGYNAVCATNQQDPSCGSCSGTYAEGPGVTTTLDDFGHGTWVSGVINAAWNNGSPTSSTAIPATCVDSTTGMAGLAGGAAIMPIKVLDCTGSGSTLSIVAGIEFAIQHGAKVLSLSLGGPADPAEQSAVNDAINAGCVVVAASGNEGANELDYPAGYPGVLSVGASDQNDSVAFYSNGGTGSDGQVLDIVAPGGADAPNNSFSQSVSFCLFSTFVCSLPTGGANDGGFLVDPSDNNFGLAAGTSGATPFVSAAAALVFSLNPTWTNTQVIQQLINNTDSLNGNSGWDTRSGYGRLNVFKALSNTQGAGQVTTYVKTFNSPNPYYPDLGGETNITLVMNQAQAVQLIICDTAGEVVLSKSYSVGQLNSNSTNPQFKSFYVSWDGKNGVGQPAKTGVYFYSVNVGGSVSRNKIVLIRGPK